MKIERMCHVSSINLTFSVHPTIDNIQTVIPSVFPVQPVLVLYISDSAQ